MFACKMDRYDGARSSLVDFMLFRVDLLGNGGTPSEISAGFAVVVYQPLLSLCILIWVVLLFLFPSSSPKQDLTRYALVTSRPCRW